MSTILVCGSRNWTDVPAVFRELDRLQPTKIIHGSARGADIAGALWAQHRGIPVLAFVANWNLFGKKAGPLRNAQMIAQKPDLVVAFRMNGESPGTDDCLRQARAAGIPTITLQPADVEEHRV